MRDAYSRKGAALLAAAVAATVAGSFGSASAAVTTPVLTGKSVRNGFINNQFLVSAIYNVKIDANASSVTVVSNDGDPVVGSDYVDLASGPNREKILVFRASTDNPLNDVDSPYTATFTARGVGQTAASPSSVEVLEFDVDLIIPFTPNVSLNGDATGMPVVVGPTDELRVTGKARDIFSESGVASGVQAVNVHFYNPLMGSNGELTALRRTVTFPCGPCNMLEDLDIDLSDLATGYWNIKLSVTDGAGNTSAQGEPMPVLKVKGA